MRPKPPITLDAAQLAELVEEHVAKLASTLRPDYLAALEASLATEESERGVEVLEQLLANAALAATEGLPLCQDTGSVWVCVEASGAVNLTADLFSQVDAAVARASKAAGMRRSMVRDALLERVNTQDNTPAFCELLLKRGSESAASAGMPAITSGDTPAPSPVNTAAAIPAATLHIMLKGGGSDNASALALLPPGVGVAGMLDFVEEAVAAKGANACPPLVVGVGVGGSFDRVAGLAKHALLRTLGSVHPNAETALLEEQLLTRINALGIGPGGLGGSTTALAVHMETAPSHIAALPVAVNIGCTALRSVSIPLF
ncbi:MAG: fumarate hydratase [Coriobacteriales bacterium]|jgi:tartrate dehydratase alpha subunit/fumarate hydratase class I-like protein|nr:fumarate hydratase [Coriobacteriales bacterium]